MNIRPYSSERWQEDCRQMSVWSILLADHKHFVWHYQDLSRLRAILHDTVYLHSRKFCQMYSVVDMIPWYYINQLDIQSTDWVLDIGCGINPFKKYIPNLQGLDPDISVNPDIIDFFDQEYITGHQASVDVLISVNAIHFAPLKEFGQRIDWCRQLLKPGGRAFVSTNLETWLMYESADRFRSVPSTKELTDYLYSEIAKLNLDLQVLDINISKDTLRDDLNGNIRLVFKR